MDGSTTAISIDEAQQRLPELIDAVARGEAFVLTIDERPVARLAAAPEAAPTAAEGEDDEDRDELAGLTPEQKERLRALGYGWLKGKLWMSEDFDEPLDDFAEYM